MKTINDKKGHSEEISNGLSVFQLGSGRAIGLMSMNPVRSDPS